MSLTTLPPEVLGCIVASVESTSTLCQLARCSRWIHQYTIPHLYHEVTITEPIQVFKGRLRSFARTVLRSPHLAGLVRHFEFHVEPNTVRITTTFPPIKVDRDEAFEIAIRASSLSKQEETSWMRLLLNHPWKCPPDAVVALILPALLKVEKLVLHMTVDIYLGRMMRRAVRREKPYDIQPLFERLKIFEYSQLDSDTKSTEFIAWLPKLPAIQEISADLVKLGVDQTKDEKNQIKLDCSSSSLTRLDIAVYGLSRADLTSMLEAPKAFKTLFYKGRIASTDFKHLRCSLDSQKNHLENLGFEYLNEDDEFYRTMHQIIRNLKPMVSFVGFNTLKFFKTAVCFLQTTENGIGRQSLIDIFPPCLETLHLTRVEACFTNVLEAVEHLLSQKSPHQIPSLRKLILEKPRSLNLLISDSEGNNIQDNLEDIMWNGTQDSNIVRRLSQVAANQGISIKIIERESTAS
ncbi:hypothetical protein MMC07_005282 [Pseudocyphellaria aurata]|nr:hypothetical protein [Pseudocyphellaria aurata]